MFERFTTQAREAVVQAQAAARELGHRSIGTEHLLLSLMRVPDGLAQRVLRANGLGETDVIAAIRTQVVTDVLDAAALETIGIDLDTVREKVEATFGPGALDPPATRRAGGHVPFAPRAKKVLELSLREAIRLKHKRIADGHLLLGILREGEGLAAKIIADAGIDHAALRTATENELRI